MSAESSAKAEARRAVFCIVVAQLFGTSVWFSANAAAGDLARVWGLTTAQLGHLSVAVQAGFIAGTLAFVLSGFADRYAASRIFVASAVVGALFNAGFALLAKDVSAGLAFRFATGFCLGGIYPIGMKLVVSWEPEKTGQALGWLVGTLTLGTATPHLVRALGAQWPWQAVVLTSSVLAVAAALLVGAVGDGPHLPRENVSRQNHVLSVFRLPDFRAAAFSYFGHMWELYAMWTITPLLAAQALGAAANAGNVALLSFFVIATGAAGCIGGGWLTEHVGSARVAAGALAVSGAMCVVYPFLRAAATPVLVALLLVWGLAVVADSPQFSALSARAAPPALVGGALAAQNCIGFAITLASIDLVTSVWARMDVGVVWLLAPGPIVGLIAIRPLLHRLATQMDTDKQRYGQTRTNSEGQPR
jgi:MFS family permease